MNYKVVAKGAATLFVKRFAGPFWFRRKWLAKTQWLSLSELQEIQLRLLKKLVRHCYNSVPFYRRLMDERAIKAESIKSLEDIKQFPILTKQDVLKAGDSIISTKYPKWILHKARTGGSTGTPMTVYRNLFSIGNEHAFVRRQWDWARIGLWDTCAYLMSRVVARADQEKGPLYTYDPIMNELILSTHHLSIDTTKEYAHIMKKYQVKALIGYPSAIGFLAKSCLDSSIRLNLKAVLTTSELLTKSMRKAIEKAFGCKVFDFYGSAERVCYIHTCECGNYHIIPEYGLTELIPIDESDRNRCKVVSTGFWNMAMPLIRYDMGDVVVRSNTACSCDRHFQVVESINGREGDVIRTSSGKHMGVTLIIQILYVIGGIEHIGESQVIQDAIDHLTIEYVPTREFEDSELQRIKGVITKYLPTELKVDLRQVKAVKRTLSGKIKPVVSCITPSESSND